ncbi:MAG: SEC-C domain-containing protein [Rhodocyclales bacterium]|nr:SEC-C domain-containing protein [Rhodocyclales bacterium]
MSTCPCGTPRTYATCCGALIDDGAPAPTAEALMRSRYTAFTLGREAYLLATWHPSQRPASLDLAAENPPPRWLGLQVKQTLLIDETHAIVEFVARYKIGGRAHRLHETSRFERVDGHWLYVDGDIHPTR